MVRATTAWLFLAALSTAATAAPVAFPFPPPGYTVESKRGWTLQPNSIAIVWTSPQVQAWPRTSGRGSCALHTRANGLAGALQGQINAEPSVPTNRTWSEAEWRNLLMLDKHGFATNGLVNHPSGANAPRAEITFQRDGIKHRMLAEVYITPGITVATVCMAQEALWPMLAPEFVPLMESFRNNANLPQPKFTTPPATGEKEPADGGKGLPPIDRGSLEEAMPPTLRAAFEAAFAAAK